MKRIVGIEIIKPGSNPDIDSDFSTMIQGKMLDYVSQTYGKNNVASIITLGSLAAKAAFKQQATIYNMPFSEANKISKSVPDPIEGVDCTLDDIYNPESDRYKEAAEFRSLTAGKEWEKIIKGAKAIEGRYRNSGVHPCGVIISNKELNNIVPLQIRKTDGRVITQWTYPECESIGLIKFDFLGLDTVDLIQHTVEYIMKNGKTPPNMTELIHGDMDDKPTYDMISRGETLGIFQLGSELVRDFLKIMKPDNFNDIAATTAIMRPGPMGMQSHTKYANRKNGVEEVEPIHPDFNGSPLDTILGKTYGLCIYQEEVMQISNQIAGMTLQEGDDLRKAMGKKKIAKMMEMKPKFITGGVKNGYSEEAMTTLWDVLEPFSKYGFNKSHSVAYAMAAYQSAWLKCHYPVEFMAALISQNIGDKDKILSYIQEARRMGIRIGGVDINRSDVNVAPDYKRETQYDILYGIAGVDSISQETAQLIIKEREQNGKYTSIHDFINRSIDIGVNNRRVYENLAKAGAFDDFAHDRKTIVENIPQLMQGGKQKATLGVSLFDYIIDPDANNTIDTLEEYGEYPYVEKLKEEANVIGLYLTGHPLNNTGIGLSQGKTQKIAHILTLPRRKEVTIAGSITEIETKNYRSGKSMRVTIDDGTAYIKARVHKNIVRGIDKSNAKERLKKMWENNANKIDEGTLRLLSETHVKETPDIEKNNIYTINLLYSPSYDNDGNYQATITNITPLKLDDKGKLPIRIRVNQGKSFTPEQIKEKINNIAEKLSRKHPGDYPIHAAIITGKDTKNIEIKKDYYTRVNNLMKTEDTTSTPLPRVQRSEVNITPLTDREISNTITYYPTGFYADKNIKVEEILTKCFGAELTDYGVYNSIYEEEETG